MKFNSLGVATVLSVSQQRVTQTAIGLGFVDVLHSLPVDVVLEKIVGNQSSLVRVLRALCRSARRYVERPPFSLLWDTPAIRHDRCLDLGIATPGLRLPAAYKRMLCKGTGDARLPYVLVALMNGHLLGYLGQERFERILKLLLKPWHQRTPADLATVGIRCPEGSEYYLAQDWTLIGLVNGVIEPGDLVEMPDFRLSPAFWRRRFPMIGDGDSLPALLPLDWMQCGCEERAEAAEGSLWARVPTSWPSIITLDDIRDRISYRGTYHYVACMASRRLSRSPYGPIQCAQYREDTIATVAEYFKLDLPRRPPDRALQQGKGRVGLPNKHEPRMLSVIAEVFGFESLSSDDVPVDPCAQDRAWRTVEWPMHRQSHGNRAAECVLL